MMQILDKRENNIKQKIRKEEMNQKLLPKNFRDNRKTKML